MKVKSMKIFITANSYLVTINSNDCKSMHFKPGDTYTFESTKGLATWLNNNMDKNDG